MKFFEIFLVIFFFMHFHSDYSSMVQDQSYIFHQWVHIKCRYTAKKRFQKLLDLFFFNNFYFWNVWNFFRHIFLHAFSKWSFKYVQDQSYIFHQWVHIRCRFTAKKRFQKLLDLVFFNNFFLKFLEYFWSYFSSCIFTVIIQVSSRPIIYSSSISSYQVPFYSEKAISEIVRLSFFKRLFFWNFWNFFGHIFLHVFSQWLFKLVPDHSYIFHQ